MPRNKLFVFPREPVARGSMRITALGSGMPYTRRAQAAPSWLVQIGTDKGEDTFIFDFGSSAMQNLNAAGVDWSKVNRIFLTHYHVDHTGDLPGIWGAGMVMGRQLPLNVHGPTGAKTEHGLNHLCEGLRAFAQWDIDSRRGRVSSKRSDELACHEFDYSKKNQTVWSDTETGVEVLSTPVTHIIDGPVGYRLNWNGLSFAFSGDTNPNTFFVDLAKNATVAVHEALVPKEFLSLAMSIPMQDADHIVNHVHTAVHSAGVVLQRATPKLGVLYHIWLDAHLVPFVMDDLRKTYTGPVAIADDLMVFELFPDGEIRRRTHLTVDRPVPTPSRGSDSHGEAAEGEGGDGHAAANRSEALGMSQWLQDAMIEIDHDALKTAPPAECPLTPQSDD